MNEKVLKNPLAKPDSEDELNSSAESLFSEHMLEYNITDIDTSASSVVSEGNQDADVGTIEYIMFCLAMAYLSIRLYLCVFLIVRHLYTHAN